jgi:hypothetical protein
VRDPEICFKWPLAVVNMTDMAALSRWPPGNEGQRWPHQTIKASRQKSLKLGFSDTMVWPKPSRQGSRPESSPQGSQNS